jgi:hypothetical protein
LPSLGRCNLRGDLPVPLKDKDMCYTLMPAALSAASPVATQMANE